MGEATVNREAIGSDSNSSELNGNDSNTRFSLFLPNATVFASSFCVMVIELVAGRIIAGHLGSSLYTWTSVIGIVLAGLATGNYLGGRLADRFDPSRTLVVLFVASSAAAISISMANNWVSTRLVFRRTVIMSLASSS